MGEAPLTTLHKERNTYMLHPHNYMQVTRKTESKKSSVIYLHVLDAKSDNRDPLMQIL